MMTSIRILQCAALVQMVFAAGSLNATVLREGCAAATLTCEEAKKCGPDVTVWNLYASKWSWMWKVPLGLLVILMLLYCCFACCAFHAMFFGAPGDGVGALPLLGYSVFLLFGIFWLALSLPLGLIVVGPLLEYLALYNLQRQIVACVPIPYTVEIVPFTVCVTVLYVLKSILSACMAFRAQWVPLDETSSVYKEWLFWQCLDTYTDANIILRLVRDMPIWIWSSWSAVCLISVCTLLSSFCVDKMADRFFWRLLCFQLFAEDIPQLALTIIIVRHGSGLDQFVVWSFIGNILGVVALTRKLYSYKEEQQSLKRNAEDSKEMVLLTDGGGVDGAAIIENGHAISEAE
eukprot:TRINITY_DN78655_c0_g1_i1.p1 TRINITY_DN78655_c0_g1~~TRINITY_DN78655_c0_g1_i1.p1  ORF type:complete len:347 (+),score=26.74 TRINITY_DN78655_c0_g1_i1:59-1099(+)